jgi:hypothetical protein
MRTFAQVLMSALAGDLTAVSFSYRGLEQEAHESPKTPECIGEARSVVLGVAATSGRVSRTIFWRELPRLT